jgi:cytoskeleton-associated protein 5
MADSQCNDYFKAEVITQLNDAQWKTRLEAMDSVLSTISTSSIHPELFFRILKGKNVWKDTNFQVTSKLFQAFETSFQNSSLKSYSAAYLALPLLADKLNDPKLRPFAFKTLVKFSEKVTLNFVLIQCMRYFLF